MSATASPLPAFAAQPLPAPLPASRGRARGEGGGRRRGRPSAPAVETGAPETRTAETTLAELLASRMCHDLSGPIGVAADARDLIATDDAPGVDAEGLALVADSARLAAARLAFFRAAFGFCADTGRPMPVAALAALTRAALASPRLAIAVADDAGAPPLPAPVARLALCLALVAGEALPRGGVVTVTATTTTPGTTPGTLLAVDADGPGARLAPPARAAIDAADGRDLTARTVVGHYARLLAERLGARLVIADTPERVRFAVVRAR